MLADDEEITRSHDTSVRVGGGQATNGLQRC
jgi:hypothetical protein